MTIQPNELYNLLLGKTGDPIASGSGYYFNCPACNNDTGHHLHYIVKDGKELVRCNKADHRFKDIMPALKSGACIKQKSRFRKPPANRTPRPTLPDKYRTKKGTDPILHWYIYEDENGGEVYRVARTEAKQFPAMSVVLGGWIWGVKKEDRIPYRLPKIISGEDPIVFVEGEKDADNAVSNLFLNATTIGGAKKEFHKEWLSWFKDREVVIVADNDDVGIEGAEQTASALLGTVKSVKIMTMPDVEEKGDLSDWINMGGSREDFLKLAKEAKPFKVACEFTASEQDRKRRMTAANPGSIPLSMIECLPDVVMRSFDMYAKAASKIQPALFLGGMIASTGALVGRRVRTINDNRTNLYICAIVGSGRGKDMTRRILSECFMEAGCNGVYGTERFASDSGMLTQIQKHPSVMFPLDEFGRMMESVSSVGKDKSPHLKSIGDLLLTLYSSSHQIYTGKAYADGRDTQIFQPNVCVYGTTTAGTLWKSFTTRDVQEGLLSRILFFEGVNDPEVNYDKRALVPDEKVIEWVRFWNSFNHDSALADSPMFRPEPAIMETTPEAFEYFKAYGMECERREIEEDPLTVVWNRGYENARRLSLIASCWQNIDKPGIIDLDTAEWSVKIIDHCIRYLLHKLYTCVADTPFEELCNAITNLLEGSGGSMTQAHLRRKLKSYNNTMFDGGVKSLIDQEAIIVEEKPSGGRPRTIYRIKE